MYGIETVLGDPPTWVRISETDLGLWETWTIPSRLFSTAGIQKPEQARNRPRRCRATWKMPDFMRFVRDRHRARRSTHVGPYLRDGLRAVKNPEQAPARLSPLSGHSEICTSPKPASEMPGHMGDAGLHEVCTGSKPCSEIHPRGSGSPRRTSGYENLGQAPPDY